MTHPNSISVASNGRRRSFLAGLAGGVAMASAGGVSSSVLCGAEPFPRSGGPRFRMGLAAYSLKDYFSFMKGKARKPKDPDHAVDMIGFLDYCVQNGFEAAELTSYFFQPNADESYFRNLKRQAFLKGVTISGTAIGNNFTRGSGPKLDEEIKEAIGWIDRAAVLGAPHIRFFAGTGKELDQHPERLGQATEALKRCADHAGAKGVFIGVENHGQLRPEQLLEIIDQVDHPWVGINLDTGNFISEDPYGDLEQCVAFAVNVQVKVAMRRPSGEKYPADFERIASLLRKANYQGFVILEYEEQDPFEEIPAAAKRLRETLGICEV